DYTVESRFWTTLTSWDHTEGSLPEFSRLRPKEPFPVQFLLQRLGEDRPTTAHIDLAASDIDATAAWHTTLGATLVERHQHWIVMADPAGAPYCVTGRDPSPRSPE
ncbi:VOC family protein, partial [Streptomyces roseolus]|uniref:VOC family protein n=1 Tax=Streptomyces roseolus TaxID=67358 RepID=UPI00365CC6C7